MANDTRGLRSRIATGLVAGFVGSLTIWIYEMIILCFATHSSTLPGVVQHTALLVFGPSILSYPLVAFLLGAVIHCATGMAWGVIFALIWPTLRQAGTEATLAALGFGVVAWVVMHIVVLAVFSPLPPIYTPDIVINGMMSHMVAFSVPLALVVQRLDSGRALWCRPSSSLPT